MNTNDGDQLTISLEYKHPRKESHPRSILFEDMRFVYENNKWYFGYINYFEYKLEEIKEGKVKVVTKN